jgi:hypothetical protein
MNATTSPAVPGVLRSRTRVQSVQRRASNGITTTGAFGFAVAGVAATGAAERGVFVGNEGRRVEAWASA